MNSLNSPQPKPPNNQVSDLILKVVICILRNSFVFHPSGSVE